MIYWQYNKQHFFRKTTMTNTEIYNLAIAQNINPSLANVIRLADFIEIGINGVVCHFNDPDECDVFVGVIVPE